MMHMLCLVFTAPATLCHKEKYKMQLLDISSGFMKRPF